MTYGLPLVFGFISYRLQSGILVYWVTTNIWSIGPAMGSKQNDKKRKRKGSEKEKKLLS